MVQTDPIKIGRIARSVERALGLSLSGEVAIYMKGKDIDALAQKRPDSYLRQLEETGSIIKNADFVCFDAEHEEFTFAKSYVKEGQLRLVFVRVQRNQTRWYVTGIESGLRVTLPSRYAKANFVRPQQKKLPETE